MRAPCKGYWKTIHPDNRHGAGLLVAYIAKFAHRYVSLCKGQLFSMRPIISACVKHRQVSQLYVFKWHTHVWPEIMAHP